MHPTQYGGSGRGIEVFPGSVFTRRWFEVIDLGVHTYLESPFQFSRYPGWDEGCDHTYFANCMRWPTIAEHIGASHCECGFYSYFGTPEPMDLPNSGKYIGAVVENFGRITYGDLGLRSAKMRIKAFVVPIPRFRFINWWRWVKSDKPRTYMTLMFSSLVTAVLTAFIGLFAHNEGIIYSGYLIGIVLYPLYSMIWYAIMTRTAVPEKLTVGKGLRKRLRIKYPGVPIYRSWKEAERDFPVTRRADLPTRKKVKE